ncbi:hypothetical protein L210DRAFT_3579519, partial [Boletus edulis BED1]
MPHRPPVPTHAWILNQNPQQSCHHRNHHFNHNVLTHYPIFWFVHLEMPPTCSLDGLERSFWPQRHAPQHSILREM